MKLCHTTMPNSKDCLRPAGHEGDHNYDVEYRQIKMHPWHEVARNFEENVNAGHYCLQSWTCIHCGAIQRMSAVNSFFKVGGCENCGQDTNLVVNGCNFTLMAMLGTKPQMREILRKMGFTPPKDN